MMKGVVFFTSLLLPLLAFAQGDIVVQPQANGNMRFYSEGGSSGTPAGMLSMDQAAGKQMMLRVLPAAPGRCDSGEIILDSIHLPMRLLINNQRVKCNELVTLASPSSSRQVVLEIENTPLRQKADSLARSPYGSRVQVGSINYQVEGGPMEVAQLYVDLSLLQETLPSLTATFENPSLDFGLVGELRDAVATARLKVSKTLHAGEDVLPYNVAFESKQLKDNQYRLRSSMSDKLIPYGVFIDGQELTPGDPYHSQVPAGAGTTDTLNIEFHLPGKVTRNMAAGARLLDTVTAVITPES